MITIDGLREYGANVDEGLARCANMADFYIKLITEALDDNRVDTLEKQVAEKDFAAAFDTAHAMKGIYENLSLDPLSKPVSEITDLLRDNKDIDYTELVSEIRAQYDKLCSM